MQTVRKHLVTLTPGFVLICIVFSTLLLVIRGN